MRAKKPDEDNDSRGKPPCTASLTSPARPHVRTERGMPPHDHQGATMNAHRLTLLLFAILLTACGADHRARNLLKQYQAAAEKNDIPTLVRLGDPNMRALIERHYEEPNYPSNAIQQILPHPVRVVRHPHGIAYIGWVGSDLV